MLNKKKLQDAVDRVVASNSYNEDFGRFVLIFAEASVVKRGLFYRYNEFDIEFVIKPRIVDMLLLKIFKYDKKMASAYTFCSLITTNAILNAIKDLRRAEKGESTNVFYIEDLEHEIQFIEEEAVRDIDYAFMMGDSIIVTHI